MRRLAALALVATPLALATAPASAVDCSQYIYIYDVGAIRGQDLNCWRNYAETRVQAVLDQLPV